MKFDLNLIRSLYTLCFFIGFVGLCIWVYRPKNKAFFDEVKMIPFEGEDISEQEKVGTKHLGEASHD